MPITEPDRAVILAAGLGSRLTSETGALKPLVRVGGKTLAEHTVLALRDGAGITNFIIVTGHEADAITTHFDLIARGHDVTVDAVTATDWRFGNGASALSGQPVQHRPHPVHLSASILGIIDRSCRWLLKIALRGAIVPVARYGSGVMLST